MKTLKAQWLEEKEQNWDRLMASFQTCINHPDPEARAFVAEYCAADPTTLYLLTGVRTLPSYGNMYVDGLLSYVEVLCSIVLYDDNEQGIGRAEYTAFYQIVPSKSPLEDTYYIGPNVHQMRQGGFYAEPFTFSLGREALAFYAKEEADRVASLAEWGDPQETPTDPETFPLRQLWKTFQE